MKKYILIIFVFLLTLTGCDSSKDLVSEASQTIEVLGEKFNYETGKSRIDGLLAEYIKFNRGDNVTITGEDDDYYYINDNHLILSIDKDYIRSDKDEPFKEYEGYTRSGSKLYSDLDLSEKIKTFSLNDKVKVIDKFKKILIIDNDGQIAYMSQDQVSEKKIVVYVAPPVEETPVYTPKKKKSSSGGGGGSSGGGGGGGGGSSSSDGEDIHLAYHDTQSNIVLLAEKDAYEGMILVDNTSANITSYKRDDVVYITGEKDDLYEILIEGRSAFVPKKFVIKDGEEEYETWDAYTRGGASAYSEYNQEKSIKTFKTNDKVKVIDEIDNICIIQLEDGQIGYMSKSKLSKDKIVVYVAPPVEETPVYKPKKKKSSGGGGGSSGGGGGGGSSQAWTDPVL